MKKNEDVKDKCKTNITRMSVILFDDKGDSILKRNETNSRINS